jgi:hypothetical protein
MDKCTKCGCTTTDTKIRGEEITIVCKRCNTVFLEMWWF